jgi:hypothetical protein
MLHKEPIGCHDAGSMRQHIDDVVQRLEAADIYLQQLLTLQLASNKEAIAIASRDMERRLEGMNGFRLSLSDQRASFVSIESHTALVGKIENDINILRTSIAEGRSLYFTLAAHEAFQSKVDGDLRQLREAAARAEGKASQSAVSWAYIFTGLSALLGIAGLIMSAVSLFH